MRLALPSARLPWPVVLWVPLLFGHALARLAPVPAAHEESLRTVSCVCGALFLVLALAKGCIHARVRSSLWLRRGEILLGVAALIAAGGSLCGEVDRIETPLPVHPRGVTVALEGRVADAVAADAAHPVVTFDVTSVRVGDAWARCAATLLVRFGDDGPPPAWATPGLTLRFTGRYRPPEDARNPGSAAPGRWLTRLGIAGTVDADPTSIAVLPDAQDPSVPWSGIPCASAWPGSSRAI